MRPPGVEGTGENLGPILCDPQQVALCFDFIIWNQQSPLTRTWLKEGSLPPHPRLKIIVKLSDILSLSDILDKPTHWFVSAAKIESIWGCWQGWRTGYMMVCSPQALGFGF